MQDRFSNAAEIRRVPINAAGAGANVIVSGVPGFAIRVLAYKVGPLSGDVVYQWETEGGTILDGPVSGKAGGGEANSLLEPHGHFQTAVGESLVLFLGDAVQVGGHLTCAIV